MAWWEATLVPLTRDLLEPLCAKLMDAGAAGFQEEAADGAPLPYLQPWDEGLPPPPPERVKLTVWFESDQAPNLEPLVPPHITCAIVRVVESDWEQEWRDSVETLIIGPRLTIAPPWSAEEGDLRIEPGLGFGTGEHPSTRGALEALLTVARLGDRLLDVGCGSGILALAAAHLGVEAQGIDIAEDAVRSARHNAALNHLSVPFSTTPLHEIAGSFDVVLANIHAEAIVALWPDLCRCTTRVLVLSGILEDREPMLKPLTTNGFQLLHRHTDGPWLTLTLEKV